MTGVPLQPGEFVEIMDTFDRPANTNLGTGWTETEGNINLSDKSAKGAD